MQPKSGSSSDLDMARQLSRRLTSPADRAREAPDADSVSSLYEGVTVDLGRAAATTATPPVPTRELVTWDDLLEWVLGISGASAAFVVDSQGFVIGRGGELPEDGFEGVGAELSDVFEKLDRIHPAGTALSSVDLPVPDGRLVGLRSGNDEGQTFMVGLVVPSPLGETVKEAVVRQVGLSLSAVR